MLASTPFTAQPSLEQNLDVLVENKILDLDLLMYSSLAVVAFIFVVMAQFCSAILLVVWCISCLRPTQVNDGNTALLIPNAQVPARQSRG